jgi:hypothetical protein
MKIQRIWENKSVPLESLTESVESFLKSKGFAVTKRKQLKFGEQFAIVAIGSHDDGSRVIIEGSVFRKKNEIFVELSAGEGPVSKMDALANLFGAGYVTLRNIKAEEVLRRLESDFFTHMDQAMANLTEASGSLESG